MTAMTRARGTETMTTRERILGCLRGEEVDRFPVWLKMANGTWKGCQPEPYRSMDGVELLRRCGCDVMTGCGPRVQSETPHVRTTQTKREHVTIETLETPDGPLTGEWTCEPQTGSSHPTKFMLETPEDMQKLRWAYKETRYWVEPDAAEKARTQQAKLAADDIVTHSGCGPTPFMDVLQHIAGPINTYYLLADDPEGFRELLDLMQEDRVRMLLASMPHQTADTYWVSENTSTSLMSPAVFAEFCVPALTDFGNICLEHGRIPVHHMCGTLNALLEQIDKLPAMANEAFTTRPLGDVSRAEGRRRMPSKALIGGTNATLWLAPVETIVRTVAEDLVACPDRRKIFLTSAGVLPPPVPFEKARAVVEALKRL